jgi:hypothetical protein
LFDPLNIAAHFATPRNRDHSQAVRMGHIEANFRALDPRLAERSVNESRADSQQFAQSPSAYDVPVPVAIEPESRRAPHFVWR